MIRITVRHGKPLGIVHAFRATHVGCSCGSTNVHPEPGMFGGMGIGLSRFWCRECRRHFWLRDTLVWSPVASSDDESEPAAIPPPRRRARRASTDESPDPALAALDRLDTTFSVPSKPADLTALDSYLERVRDDGERRDAGRAGGK